MKIKELFSSADKWTQACFARDKNGQTCEETGPAARSFCLIGAIRKCYGDDGPEAVIKIKLKVFQELQTYAVEHWNDSPARTFEEVKQLVEKLDI